MSQESPPPNAGLPEEPSVLDYLKSQLSFGRGQRMQIPSPKDPNLARRTGSEAGLGTEGDVQSGSGAETAFPWRSLLALALAVFAQHFYEPPVVSAGTGAVLYAAALGFLLWAAWRGEWSFAAHPEPAAGEDPLTFRRIAFIGAIPFAVLAFILFQGNLFTILNLALWMLALGLFVFSLWLRVSGQASARQRLRLWFSQTGRRISINRWTIIILAASAIVLFFRVYHLQQTPAEPFSDHAEKLLDVYDVSQGQTHIFFPRNTGREALQIYWTLLVAWVFGTGLSFLSLKIGTALFGLLTLPYVYRLGKEVASARVGLLAVFLVGIGYWPNVISRIGLRFPLYPLFVAPLLFYLIRGLRTRHRNDFILAGIFLGLGLHGYTPFRIVPLLVIAAFVLFSLHAQSKGARPLVWFWLTIVGLTALLISLPLLRYAMDNPDMFAYRTLTRIGSLERPLPGPWFEVFLSNTRNALRMFNWNNGMIWVHSVPNRPALDVVSGALFLAGVVLLAVRYVRKRHWSDAFILVSIPILLLPSILSLAFPAENPSLNRTAGALVPVFLLAALALDGLIGALTSGNQRPVWAYVLVVVLLGASAVQNFDLVFRQFDQNFRLNSWNSSDMGAIIKEFGQTFGETNTAWVVPFPYWVDTRLVGVWAGIPNRDFAIARENLPETRQVSGPKLFILRASLEDPSANDQHSIDLLRQLYPQGSLALHRSPIPGHDFWVYFIPPTISP